MGVQLLTRHWVITDGRGARHTVEGEGVVGEQPVIAPGRSYDYVSGCPLQTPTGAMEGSYRMIAEDGSTFDAAIPRFQLIGPAVRIAYLCNRYPAVSHSFVRREIAGMEAAGHPVGVTVVHPGGIRTNIANAAFAAATSVATSR